MLVALDKSVFQMHKCKCKAVLAIGKAHLFFLTVSTPSLEPVVSQMKDTFAR